jgi:hypothetical protein
MRSPIDRLEEELSWHCVTQCLAKDTATAQRWMTDPFAHLTEGFIINPVPIRLIPLIQEAQQQWQIREQQCLEGLGLTRESFLETFAEIRRQFLSGQGGWHGAVSALSASVYDVVRNMDWVNVFAWILPRADAQHADVHRETGCVVAAIFYTELLLRHADKNVMQRIEARWRLAVDVG